MIAVHQIYGKCQILPNQTSLGDRSGNFVLVKLLARTAKGGKDILAVGRCALSQ